MELAAAGSKRSTFSKPFGKPAKPANELENRCGAFSRAAQAERGAKLMPMNGEVVMAKVRRYRAIASLYRQTAAFRPLQSRSLLGQADEWEHLAMAELEAYFEFRDGAVYGMQPEIHQPFAPRWDIIAAA
jgi:hypothetical protein